MFRWSYVDRVLGNMVEEIVRLLLLSLFWRVCGGQTIL